RVLAVDRDGRAPRGRRPHDPRAPDAGRGGAGSGAARAGARAAHLRTGPPARRPGGAAGRVGPEARFSSLQRARRRATMKHQITRFSPHRNAKVLALTMALSTAVILIPLGILAALVLPPEQGLTIKAVLMTPLFYLVFGYAMTWIAAVVYN